jgi:hypothetical protein
LTIRGKQEYFDKNSNSTIFKTHNSQVVADPFIALALLVVADPFIALALFSPPLASSTKTGSILAL